MSWRGLTDGQVLATRDAALAAGLRLGADEMRRLLDRVASAVLLAERYRRVYPVALASGVWLEVTPGGMVRAPQEVTERQAQATRDAALAAELRLSAGEMRRLLDRVASAVLLAERFGRVDPPLESSPLRTLLGRVDDAEVTA